MRKKTDNSWISMIRSRLFWSFFGTICAVLLITILVFTGILATSERMTKREAYENEVRLQAREIAEYMTNLNQLTGVRSNTTMRYIITRKITDIRDKYNASVWLIGYDSGKIVYMDSTWNTTESIQTDALENQMSVLQSGQEIRAIGLFSELGEEIVTIGVPWRYNDGQVVGAVLLHIPMDELRERPTELLGQILPIALAALVLGVLMSVFLTRSQLKPINEINHAVMEFSKGDLTRRVEVNCGGELENLANSINRMAKDLSELEDSRRSFVAAVSHELRSPMTCMRGYVQAMLDGTISAEDMPQYLKIVMDETNRLTDLVKDLLDISRLESGKFPLQLAPFDANELVLRNLINFEPRISQKNIEVDVQLEEPKHMVTGDANRINQVVSNFIDNAVKFLPESGGKLTVGTKSDAKNVTFFVTDNGPGISDNDLPHIFERFYKADKAHTSGMGTGLGLSICRLIVREHGSDIDVQTSPFGTTFSFTLPIDKGLQNIHSQIAENNV